MALELEVIGSENSVIYYNLNKQFSTAKRVIVTGDQILENYDKTSVADLFMALKQAKTPEEYNKILGDKGSPDLYETGFKDAFYNKLMERLVRIYSTLNEVKLKDYNFMSVVATLRFSVVLRCESFSISRHFVEKGAITSNIKHLVKDYVKFSLNAYRANRLTNFQIEIYESEEPYKHVTLKKDGSSLILSSSFGYPRNEPVDYDIGPELYYSKGHSFNLFKNVQKRAVLKIHTKVEETDINEQDKVLTNEDLLACNEATKSINDAVIEMFINRKGKVKIHHVALLESNIKGGSDAGFVIYKSSNNFDRISLVTLRDQYSEDTPNPKFLLVRNQEEVRELFEGMSILANFDGLVLNTNFYSTIFEKIGQALNIDVIFYKNEVEKTMDTKISFDPLKIEASKSEAISNPFSNILSNGKKKDEFLDKLKNMDLNNSPKREQVAPPHKEAVQGIAESIISSPQSSTKKSGGGKPTGMFDFGNAKGAGAIGMLTNVALNMEKKYKDENNARAHQIYKQEHRDADQVIGDKSAQNNDFKKSSLIMDNVTSKDLNPVSSDTVKAAVQAAVPFVMPKVLTSPNVQSGSYFVTMDTISEVGEGEIFYEVSTKEEIKNPTLNYVIPIHLASSSDPANSYLLIRSMSDFFLINDMTKKYFIDISAVDKTMRRNFFVELHKKIGKVSVILSKMDLLILDGAIDKVDLIFMKDVDSLDELELMKRSLMSLKR